MSPETRSAVMSTSKGKNSGPEKKVAEGLAELEVDGESHVRTLPGCPDFVFLAAQVAVFADGDFWHGWRFPVWRDKLSEKWEAKIEATKKRNARNIRRLRSMGWTVIRLWGRKINTTLPACLKRINSCYRRGKIDRESFFQWGHLAPG